MKIIRLPRVERVIFSEPGNKNNIKQLLQPGHEMDVVSIEKAGNALIFTGEGVKVYVVRDERYGTDEQYVVRASSTPTVERLEAGKVLLKKWIKHPLLQRHTVQDVLCSWENCFHFKEENVAQSIKGLRQPQIGALYKILGHLTLPLDIGTIVLPTGTGKTETMLSTLVAHRCSKLLVTVPSESLRNQIAEKFLTLGLLKEFGIIGSTALYPIVGVIRQRFTSKAELNNFFQECNVVVTTMALLTGLSVEEQEEIASLCSHVFIDEAHHVKATSWNEFKNRFSASKILQFTATPFRNDGKRLDGKIVFDFPLKYAQEQGYFREIEFLPIREYDPDKADQKIAELAVQRLRNDLAGGYNHMLMARCYPKERAKQIFELYKIHTDLKPVLIYSGSPNFKDSYETIINKECRIIVCVDMLGEGFDLPELKIAAFHNIRKSLPITLQFAGRFTRTKHDEVLGKAAFIANIADLDVREELAELYAHDANWNQILSDTSFGRINNEIEFKDLMEGFNELKEASIPFHNIEPKLSAVVYKNKKFEWFPRNFKKAMPGWDEMEFKFADINPYEKILVMIYAKKEDVEWIQNKEIYAVNWNMIVVFWETKKNLLFINSSDNSSLYSDLAEAIIGEDAELIRGINVFKAFYEVKRTKLQNVGLRYFLGKNERFRMSVGSDVAEALSIAERQKGEKAFVMGVGYENGNPVNLGASYKGRIWSKLQGDLMLFKKWCIELGNKLANDSIDPNQILRETLIPELRVQVPSLFPVWIDWDVEMYVTHEKKFRFNIDGIITDLSNTEICLSNPGIGHPLVFSLITEAKTPSFEITLFENATDPDNKYPDFRIEARSSEKVIVEYGTRTTEATIFFEEYIPTVWFADGSSITGNEFLGLKQTIGQYPRGAILSWDWKGVDLGKEAQGVLPKRTDSIQYKVIDELKKADFDIIYDDDYSGEIADIVTLKLLPDRIRVHFYHLKFALEGRVSNQIKNLYEVCGQAQKSVHWKHKEGSAFINHLLKRETKIKNGASCSRLEKGTAKDLEKFLLIAKKEIPMEYEIYIVQPGMSKSTASPEMLALLGVTENYVKEVGGIDLRVITSD